MNLDRRIQLLTNLGKYMQDNKEDWQLAKQKAKEENGWFVTEFISLAVDNICAAFLDGDKLKTWARDNGISAENESPKKIGIVMAGNIPLVGFHDFLCGFICGQILWLKPSSKDSALIKHLVEVLAKWEPEVGELVIFADRLKGCDAYIATGSNNTGRYFEYYFRNYPSIIRKNRTSIAVLTGQESADTLEKLSDDIFLYFGFGCRNVSKLYVPRNYDFVPLLAAFDKYKWMEDHQKFKNNYDYNLSLHLLNYQYYMTNGSALLIESKAVFSPISQVNYEFYDDEPSKSLEFAFGEEVQCLVANGFIDFGKAQSPALTDYADGVDAMKFILSL